MKDIYVCADDFGLTDAASRAIVELAESRAISATSCVVDGPSIRSHSSALLATANDCALGLHLNLTENNHAGALNASLKTWIARAFVLRAVSYAQVAKEIGRQLDLYETIFARRPDFIDGHEHVHQFPIVRDALMQCLSERYHHSVAVRSTCGNSSRGFKASVIARLGGCALHAMLLKENVKTNADFAGVYDFSARVPYPTRMEQWLRSLGDQGMIMCHPESDVSASDARKAEYQFFKSTRWAQALAERDMRLIPFRAQ